MGLSIRPRRAGEQRDLLDKTPMRKLIVLAVIAALASPAGARVWTTVYRCDGVTPLPAVDPNHPTTYADIMVGTRLVLVVSSDKGEYWMGALLLSREDANYGILSGRGYVNLPASYKDSCLPAAGETASATPHVEASRVGVDFHTSHMLPTLPGDWFIFDYRAQRVGACHVGFYDLFANYNVPLDTLSFTHVPSRDFNGDGVVDFQDLALLAAHWDGQADPNSSASACDLNADGRIDLSDLALFSEYWLARTDCAPVSP
jgi:hypothetical protein